MTLGKSQSLKLYYLICIKSQTNIYLMAMNHSSIMLFSNDYHSPHKNQVLNVSEQQQGILVMLTSVQDGYRKIVIPSLFARHSINIQTLGKPLSKDKKDSIICIYHSDVYMNFREMANQKDFEKKNMSEKHNKQHSSICGLVSNKIVKQTSIIWMELSAPDDFTKDNMSHSLTVLGIQCIFCNEIILTMVILVMNAGYWQIIETWNVSVKPVWFYPYI
ncbi:hypothetical protein BDA99DRAFT_535738 [Phascolomyces articulosus]|uniref:Uncharacterized protein n=1 Tax=Phascolomyces articulosus TaxID=60185 RepID=A0AAD5K484_9FUNG|nr:hypothetical protein BDA99DRAFT_535738 [Phascolomyces articulosus]